MRVKICPQCGTQNDENAWNCANCGATLSLDTLVDPAELQASQVLIAGKGMLLGMSSYFQQDLTELLNGTIEVEQPIVRGHDICLPSQQPPFKFGYMLLTSKQLVRVLFNAEASRPWLKMVDGELVSGGPVHFLAESSASRLYHYVDRPGYTLTYREISTREVVSFRLGRLYSTELADDLLVRVKFSRDDGTPELDELPMTFYFNDAAFDIERLLEAQLRKGSGPVP